MKNICTYIILSLLLLLSCGEIKQPPGDLAPDKPKQSYVKRPQTWDLDNYHFTALAKFDLKAKVLSKEKYRYDRESDLAPYDLALGWGRMSEQEIALVHKLRI